MMRTFLLDDDGLNSDRRGGPGLSMIPALLVAGLLLAGCSGPRAIEAGSASNGDGEALFNGRDLTGWNGDPLFWRVEDGTIVGQTTDETPTLTNTFLIWDGGTVEDFTLTFDYRLSNHNSGVQYRSRVVDGWVMSGYQADVDGENRYTGMLYEEKGRGIIARRGQQVVIEPDGTFNVVGSVGDPDELAEQIRPGDWNTYEVSMTGNHLVHKINGHVTVDVTDQQTEARAQSGLLGFQLHAGPPMKLELKNIVLQRHPGALQSPS